MSRKRPQPPVKPFKKKPNPLKAAKVTEIDYKVSRPSATLSNRPSQLVLQPGSLAPARPSSSAGEM